MRRMPATHASIREGMLATPNEPALRDAGARTIGSIAKEALESMSQFGDGDMLTMP
jgi:hypothetical protein